MSAAAVFHRGALGDSVLVWPLLRGLAARYQSVAFITDLGKGQLARRVAVQNLVVLSAELPQFNTLYVPGADVHALESAAGMKLVIHLAPSVSPGDAGLKSWEQNAARMFPGARIVVDREVLDRMHAMRLAQTWGTVRAAPPPLPARAGGICISVGAGSAEKRWPLPLWVNVAKELGGARLIAGEVERERFSPPEQRMFENAGGMYLESLEQLEQMLRECSVFAGSDSGPTHVAAAMGLRTLAIFGPTDPARWAPIGPRVSLLVPEYRRGMAWVTVGMVVERLRGLVAESGGAAV